MPGLGWTSAETARLFMQKAGLMLDPTIVWNAIPFSFVADWFFPIADSLESYRLNIFNPEVVMQHIGSSVKVETTFVLTYAGGQSCGTWSKVSYTRQSGKTYLWDEEGTNYLNPLLHFSGASDGQAILGSSLLYSVFLN